MDILANEVVVTLPRVGTTPRGTDRMIANMRLHGIEVAARLVERSGSVADTILAEAQAGVARWW